MAGFIHTHTHTHTVAVYYFFVCAGDSKLFSGPGERTECGAILADGKRAVCGYTDGSVR